MIRKTIAFLLLLTFIFSNIGFIWNTYAIDTNSSHTPWTIEKAEHLAKKALFGATQEDIQELFNAGSAENAVNILFPSKEGPDNTSLQTKLNELTSDPDFNPAGSDMYNYYLAKKYFDNYEAKAKLFMIFEDTFSVNLNNGKKIDYLEIEKTHDLLYSHTLWNYKEMVKRNLNNNWNGGDFVLWAFLDLFNQTNPKRPNQNYWRELLQLMLMLEYIPTESEDTNDVRNYSESDVQAASKILFGFESNENTHSVTFNADSNTNGKIEFLEWALKTWDSFSFYDSDENTVDVQGMKQSINGNNGLPDNTIDYIFSKREHAIAMFLADKFYRYYIAENPEKSELESIATIIKNNDFELFPTVKYVLNSDMMYSEKSMNANIYKNPIELTIGALKKLNYTNLTPFKHTTQTLNWRPYYPGSIFGRNGFDENKNFYNAYTATKWVSEASRMWYYLDIDTAINTSLTWAALVNDLENKLYTWRKLSAEIKNKLTSFITKDKDGNDLIIDNSDSTYRNYYIRNLVHLMLIQPEFVLQTGHDIPTQSQSEKDPFYTNDNKLIIIKYRGGYDWLHGIIPKDEYDVYTEKRWTGSMLKSELLDLDENYYINENLAEFKKLHDSGDLKIINRVGTPVHSRGHDSASRKMTSIDNSYSSDADGIIGRFIKNEDPTKTAVLGSSAKYEMRGWQFLNIWWDALYRIADHTNPEFDTYKETLIKDIYNTRDYSDNNAFVFKHSVTLHEVAKNSSDNWGRSGAGYNMADNFTFTEHLFNSDLTNVVKMSADGGYDTHWKQKDKLNSNLARVAQRTADFYNKVKNKENVTIVLYSEFGRTLKSNSSLWTDHGKWGWMFILSNNQQFKEKFPEKIYGNLSFKNAKNNRLWVWIDYRTIYSNILNSLYNKDVSAQLWATYDMWTYIDETESEIDLFRVEYKRHWSSSNSYVQFKFDIDDKNFFPDQSSYIRLDYGTNKDDLKRYSQYYIDRYHTIEKDHAVIKLWAISNNRTYYYKLTIFDNQYNEKVIEGSFESPTAQATDKNKVLDKQITRLTKFENTQLNGKRTLTENAGKWIELSGTWSKIYQGKNNLKMHTASWTYIEELSGTWVTWNGSFSLPKEVNKKTFFSKKSKFSSFDMENIKVSRLIKVGADTLWVWMKLNKKVALEVDWVNASKNYIILWSTDWEKWEKIENPEIQKTGTKLTFTTDHFTYFAVVESSADGTPSSNQPEIPTTPTTPTTPSSGGWWGSWISFVKDTCPFGDYSPSYYDNRCGLDSEIIDTANENSSEKEVSYTEKNTDNSANMDKDFEITYPDEYSDKVITNFPDEYEEVEYEKEMKQNPNINEFGERIWESLQERAIQELKEKEENKAEIYEEVFAWTEIKDKELEKDVLVLLREKLSTQNVGKYKIVYIKKSKYNKNFKLLTEKIIQLKFSKKNELKLIKAINNFIVAFAIYRYIDLDEKQKGQVRVILLKKLDTLKKVLKQSIRDKKFAQEKIIITNPELPKKEVIQPITDTKTKEELLKEHQEKLQKEALDKKVEKNEIEWENIYTVAVHSVQVKYDISWKYTNAWLYKWDKVKVIEWFNRYWLGKVEVISAKHDKFIWKQWYIFKKYLKK